MAQMKIESNKTLQHFKMDVTFLLGVAQLCSTLTIHNIIYADNYSHNIQTFIFLK